MPSRDPLAMIADAIRAPIPGLDGRSRIPTYREQRDRARAMLALARWVRISTVAQREAIIAVLEIEAEAI